MNILFTRVTGAISGAERYNLLLVPTLTRQEKLNIFFLTNYEPLRRQMEVDGVHSGSLRHIGYEVGTKKGLLGALVRFPLFLSEFLNSLRRFEARYGKIACVCFESMTEKLFLSLAMRLLGYRVAWIEHGPLYSSNRTRVITWLYRLASAWAHVIIAVSADTKKDLVNGGVSPKKIMFLPIGVDTLRYRRSQESRIKMRKKLGIPGNSPVVGFVGSVNFTKGVGDFIGVARAIHAKHTGVRFLVVGDGPQLAWAREEAKQGLQKALVFSRFVNDVRPYLSSIDVLLMPTYHKEGLSLAILEAFAMGCIVVTTDRGGNRELVRHGKNGYLFDVGDLQTAKQYVMSLLGSPSKRMIMQKLSRRMVEEDFDIRKQAEKFSKLFQSL